jgi:hypothetical protein
VVYPYIGNVNLQIWSLNKLVSVFLQVDPVKTKNKYIDTEKHEQHVFEVSWKRNLWLFRKTHVAFRCAS